MVHGSWLLSTNVFSPCSPDDPRCVQKDGPGGKKRNAEKPAIPPVMCLRTVDGEMYLFDHGKMIETGCFVSSLTFECYNYDTSVQLYTAIPSYHFP